MRQLIYLIMIMFKTIIGSDIADGQLFEGYGTSSAGEVEQLVKALQAHEGETDIADLQAGGALQMQSLETNLALLTFAEKHLKFFKDIGITKAFSTLEEFSIQDGYGSEGGFVGQMENPEEGDPDFRRSYAIMKYIRTLWKTSDVLPLTKTITSAEVKNVQAAIMRALRVTENKLFTGDSTMVTQEFDGAFYTVENNGSDNHVFDLRGLTMTEANMRDGAQLIADNFGVATDMYNSTGVQTSIDQLIGITPGTARINQEVVSTGSGLIALGHTAVKMRTAFGEFNFKPDIFLNVEGKGVTKIKDPAAPAVLIEGATSTKAPALPTAVSILDAPGVASSLWAATGSGGRIEGEYRHRVVARNQYGSSQASLATTARDVAATGGITINITPGAGAYAAQCYDIFSEATPASGVYLYQITVTAGAATYQDINDDLPGTSKSLLVDNTTNGELRTMALSQLAPIHKVEYAKIGPYRWGTVNFYIVPKWYAPLRMIEYKNVGVGTVSRSGLLDL